MWGLPTSVLLFESVGLLAGGIKFFAYLQTKITPLRLLSIASHATAALYCLLLNAFVGALMNVGGILLLTFTLWRERRVLKQIEAATSQDFNLNWLKPMMKTVTVPAGTVLFRQGDVADTAYHIVSGSVQIMEAGVTLSAGDFFGEMAMFLDQRQRTATAQTSTECQLMTISYTDLTTLYFQNPVFGFQLVRLIVGRARPNRDPSRKDEAAIDPLTEVPRPAGA